MEFKARVKSAMWTEAEAVAVVGGGILATKLLDDRKIFAKEFAMNPLMFEGARNMAPFKIKWSGAIKAVGACFAATYVTNPWLKLALIGVAVQGTLQQARIMTFDQNKMQYRLQMIGDPQTELDQKLKALAESQRQRLNGPEYVGEAATRYESAVAGPQATRYESAVAGPEYIGEGDVYDEGSRTGWNYNSPDPSGAY